MAAEERRNGKRQRLITDDHGSNGETLQMDGNCETPCENYRVQIPEDCEAGRSSRLLLQFQRLLQLAYPCSFRCSDPCNPR